MKLYIKQKVFSFKDRFTVKDECGNDRYYVEGELLSFGKKLHIYDMNSNEVAFVKQKVITFMPKFTVEIDSKQVAEIVKKFTFLKPKYYIDGLGWDVNGDFFAHNYEITDNGRTVVSIHKQWMSWGDTFELDIESSSDEVIALAVVLAIDAVIDSQQTSFDISD